MKVHKTKTEKLSAISTAAEEICILFFCTEIHPNSSAATNLFGKIVLASAEHHAGLSSTFVFLGNESGHLRIFDATMFRLRKQTNKSFQYFCSISSLFIRLFLLVIAVRGCSADKKDT